MATNIAEVANLFTKGSKISVGEQSTLPVATSLSDNLCVLTSSL